MTDKNENRVEQNFSGGWDVFFKGEKVSNLGTEAEALNHLIKLKMPWMIIPEPSEAMNYKEAHTREVALHAAVSFIDVAIRADRTEVTVLLPASEAVKIAQQFHDFLTDNNQKG